MDIRPGTVKTMRPCNVAVDSEYILEPLEGKKRESLVPNLRHVRGLVSSRRISYDFDLNS